MNKQIYFEERWTPITSKSVPNIIEGMYFISDRGRVVSKSSHRKNIKILALVQTVNGYYRVNLRDNNGNGRYYLIHRIEMIEFICEALHITLKEFFNDKIFDQVLDVNLYENIS